MKGILFKPEMTMAILNGRKSVTRRIPNGFTRNLKAGEVVYVKEAWRTWIGHDALPPSKVGSYGPVVYEVDGHVSGGNNPWGRLRSPLHMPEWAARLRLRIVDVREEPLLGITEADAAAEGVESLELDDGWQSHPDMPGGGFQGHPMTSTYREAFLAFWDSSLHPEAPSATNPTVARIEFEVVR